MIAMRAFRFAAALGMAATLVGGSEVPRADDVRFFRIATGSIGGTYFPIGSIIASAISNPPGSRSCADGGSCGVPGLIAIAQTTKGSVENIELMINGGADSGLSQADVAYWAHTGKAMFAERGSQTELRLIASLYPESMHVVVRTDSGIEQIADLRGKRVSVDVAGSGTMFDAGLVLSAYGLLRTQYRAFHLDPVQAADALRVGEIDAMFYVAGQPVTAIATLAEQRDIRLLPIDGKHRRELIANHPYFAEIEIPADAYAGVDAVETLAVNAQWLVPAWLDDDLVYRMTSALWHPNTRRLLDRGHPEGRSVTLETALDGAAIPLHPGAARFYREHQLIE